MDSSNPTFAPENGCLCEAPSMDFGSIIAKLSDAYDEHKRRISDLYDRVYTENLVSMTVGNYSIIVDMKFEDKTITCMFDTGAQMNVITTTTIEHLKLHDYVDNERASVISGAVGRAKTYGYIPYLPLSLGERACPTNFTVIDAEHPFDCIIGILFMRHYGVVIDFDKSTLSVAGEYIPFRLDNK